MTSDDDDDDDDDDSDGGGGGDYDDDNRTTIALACQSFIGTKYLLLTWRAITSNTSKKEKI